MRLKPRPELIACLILALGSATLMADPPVRGPSSGQGGGNNGQGVPGATRRPPRTIPEKTNTAIKALKTIIKNAEFKGMPFEDFTEWLARTTNTNIVVRWKVLEAAGVERDCPIILKRKNITVRDLLPLVFRQLTEDLRDVELAAKADGKTLIISTHKDVKAKLILKTYDIQDLLVVVPNFAGLGIGDLGVSGCGGRFRVRRAHTSGRGGAGQARTSTDRRAGSGGQDIPENARKLIDIITTQIRPLSWRVNGGRGTIVFFQGKLVIRNTYEVHQMIGGSL